MLILMPAMKQWFVENITKTRHDERCWRVFAAWVDFDPTHGAQGCQFETFGHTGFCHDQEIISHDGGIRTRKGLRK
jgi:hypothetical protein